MKCLPFSILSFLLLPFIAKAQSSDCIDAEVICSSAVITSYPIEPGSDDFASMSNNSGCLVIGENQSAWYYFQFRADMPPNSIIKFVINPNASAPQDYDFAVFGPDARCDSLGMPLRCSFADAYCLYCPQTGLGMGATDFSEPWSGDGFVAPMQVQPGQGFYLLIDNFVYTGVGFTLTWSGSAAPFLGCPPECQIAVAATSNYSLCEGTSTQFMANATGISGAASYEWTASNGADAYLSNSSILQPIITVPIGAPGTLNYALIVTDSTCADTAYVTVNVLKSPTPVISGIAEFCQGDSTVLSLDTTYVAYQWSTGSAGSTAVVSTSGNVTVSVTNAAGCTSSSSYMVMSTPALTIIEVSFCENQGLLFADSLITAEGVYEWQYTTTAGCDSAVQLIATFAPFENCIIHPQCNIVVTATPNYSLCEGTSTQLMANATGVSGAESYEWIGDNGAEEYLSDRFIREPFVNVPVGAPDTLNYTLATTEGVCTYIVNVMVNVLKLPAPVISGATEFCQGDSIVLSVDTIYSAYQWSTGSADSTAVVSASGNVTVSVTNAAGCTSSANYMVVEHPSALTIIEASFCENEGLLFADSLITAEGVYEWQYTTTAGCDSVVQLVATFAPFEECAPECQIAVTATPNYSLCEGTSTQFMVNATGASGAESYEWVGYNGAEEYLSNRFIREPLINVPVGAPDTLNYAIIVTDGTCADTTYVTVNVLELPAPVIGGAAEFCEGDSIVLSVDTIYSAYQWSTGSADSTAVISASGNVTVSVTNAAGCTSPASYLVVEHPSALTTIEASFCENEGLLFADSLITAEGVYEWQYTTTAGCDSVVQLIATELATALTEIDTMLTLGQPFNGVLYLQDTTLEFALQTIHGCDSLVQVHLQIVTSTDEPGRSLLAVHLFPNPTTGAVTLRFDQMPSEPMRIYLFNELGQTMLVRKLSTEQEQRLNLDALPSASYRAVIMAAGKVLAVEKLVVL